MVIKHDTFRYKKNYLNYLKYLNYYINYLKFTAREQKKIKKKQKNLVICSYFSFSFYFHSLVTYSSNLIP